MRARIKELLQKVLKALSNAPKHVNYKKEDNSPELQTYRDACGKVAADYKKARDKLRQASQFLGSKLEEVAQANQPIAEGLYREAQALWGDDQQWPSVPVSTSTFTLTEADLCCIPQGARIKRAGQTPRQVDKAASQARSKKWRQENREQSWLKSTMDNITRSLNKEKTLLSDENRLRQQKRLAAYKLANGRLLDWKAKPESEALEAKYRADLATAEGLPKPVFMTATGKIRKQQGSRKDAPDEPKQPTGKAVHKPTLPPKMALSGAAGVLQRQRDLMRISDPSPPPATSRSRSSSPPKVKGKERAI